MIKSLFFILFTHKCSGVVYHLNETEYQRMPPLFAMDEYETCLSNVGDFYCLVRLDLHAEPSNELIQLIHNYSKATTKHYNHTYIDRGVCVKRRCEKLINNSAMYKQGDPSEVLVTCINESIWEKYGLEVKLNNVHYCDKHNEQKVIDILDMTVAAICLLIILFNIVGSCYDYHLTKSIQGKDTKTCNIHGNQYLRSFSLIRNWKNLVALENEKENQRLIGLHGVRSLANILVILGHAIWIIASGYTNKPHNFEMTYEAAKYQIIYNGTVIVQIFFLISGFFLMYKLQTEKQITWRTIPRLMLQRWWRLTPPYALMLALTATWLRHAGSGPLWNLYVTNNAVADCRKYWWQHLLYINNFFPDNKFCVMQTWHTAADTQIYFLALIVCATTKPNVRNTMLAILLLLGVAAPAFHVWLWDLDAVLLTTPEFYRTMRSDTYRYSHVFSHNNLTCFVIGMMVQNVTYKLQLQNIDFSKNKIISFMGWLVIPGLAIFMYSGHVFYADAERASLAVRIVYAGTHRLIVGMLVAFGIGAIILKAQNPLRHVLEWRGWLVPSRLSYSVFLLHVNIIYIIMGIRTELGPVSFYDLIINHVRILAISLLMAVPFHLMVEAPMNKLVSVTMRRKTRRD